ncbi:MAG: hypothetical protein MUF48_13120 [Pirellulaceae bacterium]|nr:hypothetical protein [Pirellulaceae bacterium]
MRLSVVDYLVLAAYFAVLAVCSWRGRRHAPTDEDYFLVGRQVLPMVLGLSVMASMLSSITYLAEPGEVWKSGITHSLGKLLGIPLEAALVWGCCIPFMMRFRFTSVYEYLEGRFGRPARRVGAALFVVLVLLWMGFVLVVLAQVVTQLTGLPRLAAILAVGAVTTAYTAWGGLRVVIGTDLVQVMVLTGGAVLTILYVAWKVPGSCWDWIAAAGTYLARMGQPQSIPWFSWDPTQRTTVVTAAVNMAVWHLCMHTSNQMAVQRYFSARGSRHARRGFLVSTAAYVGITLLLMGVGLAVLYYYHVTQRPLDGNLDPFTQRDLIFPTFVLHHLPTGAGGMLLAALLAAAMSTVDSGLNSLATVISLELRPNAAAIAYDRGNGDPVRRDADQLVPPASHVGLAMWLTVAAGAGTTVAAWALTWLPASWGIYDAIPRTFNAITGPLGGLFFVGMFLPQVRQAAALGATGGGLVVSLVLGYLPALSGWLQSGGWQTPLWPEISFTWILPVSFLFTVLVAPVLSLLDPTPRRDVRGLTWWTRHQLPSCADRTRH